MENDLERRLGRLEERLGRLERKLDEAREHDERKRRRERWTRMGIVIAVGLAYAFYIYRISSVL